MHTKTASAVLKPLADAVSALIVIISESEISGTPTPNLTQLSKAVDLQIKNLSNVAKRIIEQPSIDSQIKETMTAACERGLECLWCQAHFFSLERVWNLDFIYE